MDHLPDHLRDDLPPGHLLNTVQAAERVTLKPVTLEQMRSKGTGPKYVRLGARRIAYRVVDLDDWVTANVTTPRPH